MYIEKGVIILLIFNFFSTLLLQIQFHGAVVAAQNLGVNLGVGYSFVESLGCHEIVDTPSCILLPRLEAV